MRDQVCLSVAMYVCVRVCPSADAAGKPLGSLQHRECIFDRRLRYLSPSEGGGFTSARKCKIRGQIRGIFKIRGKFPFSRLNPGKRQFPCMFLAEDYDFQVLVRLSSFLLPVMCIA